jgi:TRAP-type C4-dicarboxylate transport system permease large subunit
MPNTPDIPAFESARVLTRFFLRLTILCVFAGLGHQGFGTALESMLILAVLYCIVAAAVRREHLFGPLLSHFDEAAAYVVVACLVARAS